MWDEKRVKAEGEEQSPHAMTTALMQDFQALCRGAVV